MEHDEAVRLGEGRRLEQDELTIEKMAVLSPMPRARAATAAAVKPRLCQNMRKECWRSCRKLSILSPRRAARAKVGQAVDLGKLWRRALKLAL